MLCAIGLLFAAPGYAQEWIYAVRPGDTLWELSKSLLKQASRWADLQRLNKINDPQRIPPGTSIRIPIAWLKHQPVAATVVDVRGTVKVVSGSRGRPMPLAPGAELRVGDRIQTGSDSSATIQFADQSLLLIQADTIVDLDTLSAFGKTGMVDTRVRLQRGRGESRVTPARGPGSRYQIITPAAVTAVRGTSFRVATAPTQGTTRTEVVKGNVEVEGAGVRRLVPAGFGAVTEVGKPPSKPRRLLTAPDLRRLPSLVKRVPLVFEWSQVDGAHAYRAQIFAGATFRRLLLEQLSQQPRVQWAEASDGRYVLRVRAIDGVGLEGLNADHPFTIDTGPKAPLPREPRAGETLRTLMPEFSWVVQTGVIHVHLQVARDRGFKDIVFEVTGDAAASAHPDKPFRPGSYYWRLASQSAPGDKGPFGPPRHFRLQPLPPQPRFPPPVIEGRRAYIEWGAIAHAAQYRCQFSRNAAFLEIIEEAVVNETRCHTGRLSLGNYYVRVQGIGAEGTAGAFSDAARFEVAPPNYLPIVLLGLLLLLLLLL